MSAEQAMKAAASETRNLLGSLKQPKAS
jgi:multiple sugar transport system substrate-binding protein